MTTHRRHFLRLAPLAALSGLAVPAFAAPGSDNPIGIAYQTVVDPAKVAQADGLYEKAIGKPLAWKKFESGADVIAAVASGDISTRGSCARTSRKNIRKWSPGSPGSPPTRTPIT
ncbi:hypothetical protein [Crenobacter cavernae]|uniref:hypothetical protein n=1 Tax=Crenobacter cavernae TaxID=2290923 RepID=UPI001F0C9BE5|nr:hypothetical protein [Crenobacter cavernae]